VTVRRALLAASIGNCVEWFDFAVYGYLASTLALVFFPSDDPRSALLSTLAVFAVAFFTRPLGGVYFGRLGDRVGRRRALAASILLASGSTFAIGVLPGYAAIGALAPALLVLARCAQGFSVGGEFSGASSFIAEYASDARRGFLTSWTQFSALTGLLLGSCSVALLTAVLAPEALVGWGWRLPFLLAGPLGVVGLYLRLRMEDTPLFTALARTGGAAVSPIREVVTQRGRMVLLTIALVAIPNALFYTVLTYLPLYFATELGFGAAPAFASTTATLLVVMALIPCFAALSDRVGRKPLMVAAAAAAAVVTYPAFVLMAGGGVLRAALVQAALGVVLAGSMSCVVAVLAELFPTRVRYSGFAIGHNLAAALFGGTAPFLATYLIAATGSTVAPAFYVVAVALLSLAAASLVRETARTSLGPVEPVASPAG
jgi:MHS family proline/betaine transporter-like MFS transporter